MGLRGEKELTKAPKTAPSAVHMAQVCIVYKLKDPGCITAVFADKHRTADFPNPALPYLTYFWRERFNSIKKK
ncbi:hypothetical protein JTE90_013213 [Oedothorax gibbosus]|uniref:Uncharacterized protein n=1 Tax=Oedothorax gibbosus TaxID=931172 RepID=A0AAV6UKK1_9ARAC|nr:hypothetical protein JTE90_013213 [Oedothorax gibbosus]